MRTAVLLAATAAALTLSACNRPDEATTGTAAEAADASGAAVDVAATTSGGAGGTGSAGSATARAPEGETMDPATGGTVSGSAMAPSARPGDTAGNNVTETERRLNPPAVQ